MCPRYIRSHPGGPLRRGPGRHPGENPVPFVCGYACVHPCEAKCSRNQFEGPVAIRMLKRVAAEKGWKKQPRPVRMSPTGKKVAVIGSGPAGLYRGVLPLPAGTRRDRLRGPGRGGRLAPATELRRLPAS
ncbi:MAG: hypothetical protein MZV70_41440 [Desulfobacterales bacterium]|nr:hypothetical protein [Desulfobacterales bacterium]